jgi:putative flippase GtrA
MKKGLIQVAKYGIVGLLNTLLTAIVIWAILKFIFEIKDDVTANSWEMSVSNLFGYVVGLINSFILNKIWTFKSKASWKTGFLKFMLVFGFCYIIQLGVVLILNKYASIPSLKFDLFNKEYIITSAYIYQLLGIVSYTGLNFLFNKYYTFKR